MHSRGHQLHIHVHSSLYSFHYGLSQIFKIASSAKYCIILLFIHPIYIVKLVSANQILRTLACALPCPPPRQPQVCSISVSRIHLCHVLDRCFLYNYLRKPMKQWNISFLKVYSFTFHLSWPRVYFRCSMKQVQDVLLMLHFISLYEWLWFELYFSIGFLSNSW